jgi:hypothetical protein
MDVIYTPQFFFEFCMAGFHGGRQGNGWGASASLSCQELDHDRTAVK